MVVGWSFGGSPCFKVAGKEPTRLRGVATVASQTAQTEGVHRMSPRPLLLLHGTGDRVLSSSCSESLYNSYGAAGQRELKLFPGDDHGLTQNAPEVEKLIFEFAAKCLGFDMLLDQETVDRARQDLVESKEERVKEMLEGRDLEREKLS